MGRRREEEEMTTTTTTIEIPIDDFFAKNNAALVRLLKAVEKSMPDGGIATRRLCQVTFDSRSYGLKIIERAEKYGYITRTGKPDTAGGGLPRICKITKKGRGLLKQLAS